MFTKVEIAYITFIYLDNNITIVYKLSVPLSLSVCFLRDPGMRFLKVCVYIYIYIHICIHTYIYSDDF